MNALLFVPVSTTRQEGGLQQDTDPPGIPKTNMAQAKLPAPHLGVCVSESPQDEFKWTQTRKPPSGTYPFGRDIGEFKPGLPR